MIDLIEMMRPLNCVMACIGVLVGGLIVTGSNIQVLFSTPFILAVISVFLITGAGNMFNDYVDVEADKICLLYTSPSPRDRQKSRMPSSA